MDYKKEIITLLESASDSALKLIYEILIRIVTSH